MNFTGDISLRINRQNPATACDLRSLIFFSLKKQTFDQKNGLLRQKTDHFCALKSEMVCLQTKVRKKRTSYKHCKYYMLLRAISYPTAEGLIFSAAGAKIYLSNHLQNIFAFIYNDF